MRRRDRVPVMESPAVVLEVFAGLGCVADGFADTGAFEVGALTDWDPAARRAYVGNRPEMDDRYLLRDVKHVSAEDLRAATGGREVVGFLGCPPCQGWSAAGPRAQDDPRNQLVDDYFRLMSDLDPLFFVMENVPSSLRSERLAGLLHDVSDRYAVWSGVLNAACYGLPQTRQRAVVLGYRRDAGIDPTRPPETHFGTEPVFGYRSGGLLVPSMETADEILGAPPEVGVLAAERHHATGWVPEGADALLPLVTVGDALRDLRMGGAADPASAYAVALGAGDVAPTNHGGWRHGPAVVERLAAVPEGGRPAHDHKRRYFSQAYGRLHRQGLARTVTTNFHNAGSGRFTHYGEARTLTVREAARLQGIPDSFVFSGAASDHERLVGNAFPRLWAERIARHVGRDLGLLTT